jgi:hypothetical protein
MVDIQEESGTIGRTIRFPRHIHDIIEEVARSEGFLDRNGEPKFSPMVIKIIREWLAAQQRITDMDAQFQEYLESERGKELLDRIVEKKIEEFLSRRKLEVRPV